MESQSNERPEYLSLSEIANIAPGRPSANCVWRWCRRGVLARTGERIRLKHIRAGGQIFSTTEWFSQFGHALADADAKYFDLCEAAAVAASNARQRRRAARKPNSYEQQILERRARVARELDDAGIR